MSVCQSEKCSRSPRHRGRISSGSWNNQRIAWHTGFQSMRSEVEWGRLSWSWLSDHLFWEMFRDKERSSSPKLEKHSFSDPCWWFPMQRSVWCILAMIVSGGCVSRTVHFQAGILRAVGQHLHTPKDQWVSNLIIYQHDWECLWKQIIRDTHPLDFWFRRSWRWGWELGYLTSSQVLLLREGPGYTLRITDVEKSLWKSKQQM